MRDARDAETAGNERVGRPWTGTRRRDWYSLEERHEALLRGRAVALLLIAAAAMLLPRDATPREHLLAAAACGVALVLHLGLFLLPRVRTRSLLTAVDAAIVVDAALIFVLAWLSGGVDGMGLWLLPALALAMTLGHSTGFGVKALILGGIVYGALYAVDDMDAPGPGETIGPLVVAAGAVVIAAVFNEVNGRDMRRRLARLDDKWAASAALTAVEDRDEVVRIARTAFAGLLPGWDVEVGLGGGASAARTWRHDGLVTIEVPLTADADPDDSAGGAGGVRTLGRLTATRPLPRWGPPTVRRREMDAVAEVAADAGAALARIEAVARLEQLSMADPLTGLGNRRAFDQALDAELARSERSGDPVGLVMIDVDHFKAFNDRHGHQAGDDALVAVAAAMRGAARRADMACRIGGEEFALLLPGADEADAAAVAERVRSGIESEPPPAGPVTLSLGVAAGRGGAARELLQEADLRLYSAKESGRNRVVAGTA